MLRFAQHDKSGSVIPSIFFVSFRAKRGIQCDVDSSLRCTSFRMTAHLQGIGTTFSSTRGAVTTLLVFGDDTESISAQKAGFAT